MEITDDPFRHRALLSDPKMNMTKAQWDLERLASLTAWYGKSGNLDPSIAGDEARVIRIQPGSTNGRILNGLQDLLDGRAGPEQLADTLVTTVLSDEDPDRAWSSFTGHTCMAAEFLEQTDQQKMVEMLVSVAKLPYDLPTASCPTATRPGDKAMAELPNFGFTLGEYMQGPRAYFCRLQLVTPAAQLAAAARWRNISTFAALCTRARAQHALPRIANMSNVARFTLAHALEHGLGRYEPFTKDIEYIHLRDPPWLWAAAAASWMVIAGDYIREDVLEEPESMRIVARPLWIARGGNDILSTERWAFWKERLLSLAEVKALPPDTRDSLTRAARAMRPE